MGASRQSASMGSFLTICQTCPSCPHLVDRCGGSLELCSGNKHIVKLEAQLYLMALWLCCQIPAEEVPVEIPGNALLISTYCHKMVCENNRGERSQDYVQGVSAVSCRMKEIKGVGTVQLVYIGGLLRMGNDSLLDPVWRSV